MKSLLLALALLVTPRLGLAVLHPKLIEPRISSCSKDTVLGIPCAWNVFYTSGGSVLTDVTPMGPTDPNGGTTLRAVGVHCRLGNSDPSGATAPFTDCRFSSSGHAPVLSNCRLISSHSWELTSDSTCSTTTSWGAHSGAGPGGECVVFVQADHVAGAPMNTIFGRVTAEQVANGGNQFCQKPLPPSVACDVSLPATIDHGTVGPDSRSSISVTGTVSCGANPVVNIMGGGSLTLAPGVSTVLAASRVGRGQIQITSDLVAKAGATGDHSGSAVIVVSPW